MQQPPPKCVTTCGLSYNGVAACDDVQEWETRTLLALDAYEVPRLIYYSFKSIPRDGFPTVYLTLGAPWAYAEACEALSTVHYSEGASPTCAWGGDQIEMAHSNYKNVAAGLMVSLDMCYSPEEARWTERGVWKALFNVDAPDED